jgi:two-component system chemotaxis response regulator CheY
LKGGTESMKMNVLIVEDELPMRILIKKVLYESKIRIGEIFEAENGEEGLKKFSENRVDLLLVDIYMPLMDGIEMLEHLHADSEEKEIPVVVVSTESDEDRIDAIVKRGIGFVHKPFTKRLLEEEILKQTGALS